MTIDEINETLSQPEIHEAYGMSVHKHNKKPFFDIAVNAGEHSYCIMSSKETIELFKNEYAPTEWHILMDATFKIVPTSVFKQLLIIYVRIKFEVSEFVPILNSNKFLVDS